MYPLAERMVSQACQEAQDQLRADAQNADLPWEEVSKRAGAKNLEILRLLDRADSAVEEFRDQCAAGACSTGMRMFEAAAPHVDPEFVPDLIQGVNQLVLRAMQGAEQGHPIPINFMDMATRKMIFLVESYMRAPEQPDESLDTKKSQ